MSGEYRRKYSFAPMIIEYMLITVVLLTIGMSSSMIKIMTVALISISFLVKSKERVACDVVWYYSFFYLFKISGIGMSYYNVIMSAAIIRLLFAYDEKPKIYLDSYKIAILMIISIYSYLISIIYAQSAMYSVLTDVFLPFVIVICLLSYKFDKQLIRDIILIYATGIVVSGILGSGYISIPGLSDYIITNAYRFNGLRLVRLQGLQGNPNYFSVDINIAIALLISMIKSQQFRTKVFDMVLIVILTILGVMTLSKTFIITYVIMVMLIIVYETIGKGNISGFLKMLPIIVIVTLVGIASGGLQYTNAILSRISDSTNTANSFTSGRLEIWRTYILYLIKSPLELLMGAGINAVNLTIGQQHSYPTHNLLLEIVYTVGLVGMILYTWLFKNLFVFEKKYFYALLPLLIFLIRSFAINMLYRESLPIQIIVMVLMIRLYSCDKPPVLG